MNKFSTFTVALAVVMGSVIGNVATMLWRDRRKPAEPEVRVVQVPLDAEDKKDVAVIRRLIDAEREKAAQLRLQATADQAAILAAEKKADMLGKFIEGLE